ncbi:MAG TPA: response regulator [Pirellulales bacterium]|nr:response regulator [Pirellulales bacterium]
MIAEPLSILITDDDVRFRETLKDVIAPQGFRTLLAGDGQEALEIVERDQVHLLLLDMHMPRLTGLETIQRVKRFNARLPCILLSAEADETLVRRALEAQAFAVLHKPVSRESVIANVRQALHRAYDWRERNVT